MNCDGSGMMGAVDDGATKVRCFECGALLVPAMMPGNGFAKIPPHDAAPKRSLGIRAVPPSETLTKSEKALARMLAEWLAWREVVGMDTSPEAEAMRVLGQGFVARGMLTAAPHEPSAVGADLLARARKAGVL